MSYIDGLASGLDTTTIIKSLMELEARPKMLLEQRKQVVSSGLDAFGSIRTKVQGVRSAAENLASSNAWRALAATSSNPEAVAVSAGTGNPSGSISFSVSQLATSMQRSSADTFSAANADLDGRAIDITRDGHTFSSTATTLDGLVAEINADDDLGVRASVLQVSPGQFRLVLSGTETGVDNAFTVASSGWSNGFAVTRQAQDAVLDAGGITITRPSNTIDDLLSGTTITLRSETTSPVTVGVERDVDGISGQVAALVEAMNAALGEIKLRTDYDPETNQRSSLTGDATARNLAQSLTRALSGAVSQSDLGSVGLAGIGLTRDGRFEFDAAAFKSAYENDPAAVQRLFVAGAEASEGISFVSAGWRAAPGTHAVEVANDGGVWTAKIGGETATVSVNDDGSLRLTVPSTNERLGGMTLRVSVDQAATAGTELTQVGSIDYEPGAARRLTTATNRALDAVSGTLTSAEQSRETRIKDINRQISAWEIRLEQRELRLRQQYTMLESALGQLGNQANWLSGQIAGLTGNNNK